MTKLNLNLSEAEARRLIASLKSHNKMINRLMNMGAPDEEYRKNGSKVIEENQKLIGRFKEALNTLS